QNFFSKKVTGFIFSQGQCVPIVRGAGINQPGFEYLKKILQEGGWVHIFPEGTRNRKPELGIQNNFTQGIAHLLLAANPVALPFYHSGMEKILPVGAILPRIGKKVKIVFGEPILFDEELCKNILKENSLDTTSSRESVQVITDWTFQLLKKLEQNTNPL
ncbi:MAG TPA: lysophospholipid acyltransferase family protein, partial [Leptospiraceae bacterium]|nr:lysophospholipid acyltransferase family protein [Leptospiraceae bacterium]